MARGFSLTSDRCGHTKKTAGWWAFYTDEKGNRVRVSRRRGHKRPIEGHEARMYRRECCKTQLIIAPNPREDDPQCPKCDSDNLVFSIGDDEDVVCPKCEEGMLRISKRWIT